MTRYVFVSDKLMTCFRLNLFEIMSLITIPRCYKAETLPIRRKTLFNQSCYFFWLLYSCFYAQNESPTCAICQLHVIEIVFE